MSSFAENLRRIRLERNMSQDEMAALLGTSKQVISRYENDQRSPKVSVVAAYAEKLGVTIGYLSGEEHPLPSNLRPLGDLHRQRVPLIGSVAAGQPIMAEQDYETFVDAPVDCDAALEVKGDSMKPTYLTGDILYIKCMSDVPDGQVAVVLLDDEATLKHVYHDPNGLTLISDNPDYPPIRAHSGEYDYIAIYGVPVGYTRIYRSDPKKKIKKGMR